MSQLDKLYIAATGMITPVGMDSEMTAASVKAGISGYGFSDYYHGNSAIKMASVPEDALAPLSPELLESKITSRQARMLRLSEAALGEILKEVADNTIPIFLAGPEPVPNEALPMRSVFIRHLQVQTGAHFDLDNSKVFPMGRAGVFYALESAFRCFEELEHKYVLVGGVDSYFDPSTLGFLSKNNRIQTESGEEADAFVPGEGAGFLLLTKTPNFENNKGICRPGISEELGHRYSEEPYQGDGLSQAFSQAIHFSGTEGIMQMYSSLNGESFGAKEYGVAVTRNSSAIHADCDHIHPADCYGDIGAASGAVLLALSVMGSSAPILCYGSSDDEFRGAACVI